VGMSRVKTVGDEMFYEGLSPDVLKKYAQGMVWQRLVTTTYPDEGVRLPYHVFEDRPELLGKFLYLADNPENFKYATRHVSDDDALGMVERFRKLVVILKDVGDKTDNWDIRLRWLDGLIAELWKSRGLFPGLPIVLSHLRIDGAASFFKRECLAGRERQAKNHLFSVLDGKAAPSWDITEHQLKTCRKTWVLLTDSQRVFLAETFSRFALNPAHLKNFLDNPMLYDLKGLSENPYRIVESYLGKGTTDHVNFHTIDRGMFPSPELGEPYTIDLDHESRLRALMVDVLREEPAHIFLSETRVLELVNDRLAHLPEWKAAIFHSRYIDLYQGFINQRLVVRQMDQGRYVYLRTVYEDERLVEDVCVRLAGRADIQLKTPLTEDRWMDWLSDVSSPIREQAPDEYRRVIRSQAQQCAKTFVRPLNVISGYAGTGKTTVIRSIFQAVERVHGAGAPVVLLAPTGKAADRIRQATQRPAQTVHAFLARLGWLKDGYFRREGGARAIELSTYIIDEASMLNLETIATLFRAIDPHAIQRLILVGDPNQLPPIGRGRFFADLIEWVDTSYPDCHAQMIINIRQMSNHITGNGTGIMELADAFLHHPDDSAATDRGELLLSRLQEGGRIDKDLPVVYWETPDDLYGKLIDQIVQNMEEQTGTRFDEADRHRLWYEAFKNNTDPDTHQVITPYRAEEHGTSNLNALLQRHSNQVFLEKKGEIGGITAADKVIQIVNRTQSNPV
ncbi:MAG: AAA family ATPase, partial [Firmicutes bacterium]|nr:AAA family ATPase [Bacillota bacterium]